MTVEISWLRLMRFSLNCRESTCDIVERLVVVIVMRLHTVEPQNCAITDEWLHYPMLNCNCMFTAIVFGIGKQPKATDNFYAIIPFRQSLQSHNAYRVTTIAVPCFIHIPGMINEAWFHIFACLHVHTDIWKSQHFSTEIKLFSDVVCTFQVVATRLWSLRKLIHLQLSHQMKDVLGFNFSDKCSTEMLVAVRCIVTAAF